MKKPNSIEIENNGPQSVIPYIKNLTELKSLSISFDSGLSGIKDIEGIRELRFLKLSNNGNFRSLEGVEDLKDIRDLTIGGTTESVLVSGHKEDRPVELVGVDHIGSLQQLESLSISQIAPITSLILPSTVTTLRLSGISDSYRQIQNLNSVSTLEMDNFIVSNLEEIDKFSNLKEMIFVTGNIESLSGIEKLRNLRSLTLRQGTFTTNFRDFGKLDGLSILKLEGTDNKNLDMEGIIFPRELTELTLRSIPLSDFAPVGNFITYYRCLLLESLD